MITAISIAVILALPAGWFAGVLIDRVPDREPLRPLPGVRAHGVYLAVHLVMVVVFVIVGVRFDDAPVSVLLAFLLFFAMLVTVSVIDLQLFRLPDRIVLPTLAASLLVVPAVSLLNDAAEQIRYAFIGGAVYFLFLFVTHLIYPRGMGFGDVKLAAVMGLYVGWLGSDTTAAVVLVFWAMLIGFIGGSIVGIVMLVARRRSQPIPFGPFLAFGALVAVLASPGLVQNPVWF